MWVTSSSDTILTPTAIALGNFDGIHQGHRQVIQPALDAATSFTAERVYATVVTFNPHPQEFFSGQPRCLLTPLPEKVAELKLLGIEQLVLLPFDRELANLSPPEFVERILVTRLQAKQVSVGADFCFGRQRAGTATELQRLALDYGVAATVAPLQELNGDRISSSRIRQALLAGDLLRVKQLLGHPYRLLGEVVVGQQLGRTIGFPTANLKLPPEKFLPRQGVYAVRVGIGSEASPELTMPLALTGVMNLGQRPTVGGVHQTIEVHILGWAGDLYGNHLVVSLEAFIRPEQKFSSLEELKLQIQKDCAIAKTLLAAETDS